MYFVDHHTRTTTWEDPRSNNAQVQGDSVVKVDGLSRGMGNREMQDGRTSLEGADSLNREMSSSPLRAKL